MKFSNSLFFISLLAGIVIIFFMTLYKPVNRDIHSLQKDIVEGQRRNCQERLISQVLDDKSLHVADLRREVEALKKGLLPSEQPGLFMNDLRESVIEFGFHGDTINPRRALERRGPFQAAVLELELVGGFKEIYLFIQKLEELRYAVMIDNLVLQGQVGEEGDWVTAKMTISAPLDNF